MNEEELERRVTEYLDERLSDPQLAPRDFARRFGGDADALERAIACVLGIEATLAAACDDEPTNIGPYTLVRELGRGGMGVVYEAERGGRRFALKLMGLASGANPSALPRFHREVQALQRLQHSGIVALHDWGLERGSPYLVMELLEGQPLSRVELPLEPRRAATLVAHIARSVAAAHSVGVLHRDLKPSNVIVVAARGPVLLDFGLAAAHDDASLTDSGAVLGTPRYMAPEQARGEPADERCDVFALGLILFELLFGRPARAAKSRSALLRSAARGVVDLPRAARSAYDDRGLERVLRAALAWNPQRRTSSASALAADLERWLAGEPVAARAPSLLARASDSLRRRSDAWTTVGAVVLATLGAASWLWRSNDSADLARELERRRELALVEFCCGAPQSAARAYALAHALDSDDERTLRIGKWIADGDAHAGAAPLAPGDELALLTAVRSQRRSDPQQALVACAAARAAHPRSAALAALHGDLLEQHEGDASDAWRAALELAPGAPSPRWRLAQYELLHGSLAAALEHAVAACERFDSLGVDATSELPKLLARAREPAPLRELLRERAESGRDARLWYALAWMLDSDHELERAAQAYERALQADPGHLLARLNLAHLYGGAQLGACGDCERAYGACAECFDPARALAALIEVLTRDHGESEFAVGRVVQTALDLVRRAPQARAPERLIEQLDRLLAESVEGRSAAVRLADARERLTRAIVTYEPPSTR